MHISTARLKNTCLPVLAFLALLSQAFGQATYTRRSPNPMIDSIYQVAATSELNAVVYGSNKQYMKTIDGGVSWQRGTAVIPDDGEYHIAGSIDFITSLICYAGFERLNSTPLKNILKSTDGGFTWTFLPTSFHVAAYTFFDEQNGFASGYTTNPTICFFYRTTDGGATWQEVSQQQTSQGATKIVALNTTSFLGINEFEFPGRVCKGTNGGTTLSYSNPLGLLNYVWKDIVATPSGKIYALGGRWDYSYFSRAASADGGATWTSMVDSVNYSYPPGFRHTRFFSDNIGFTYQPDGRRIYKTLDGGFTWNQSASEQVTNFLSGDFINQNTAWGISESRGIFRSNGVTNWINCHSPLAQKIVQISKADNSTIWAATTSRGYTYKSTTNGASWTQVPIDSRKIIHKIDFKTPLIGYALPSDTSYICKTIDGGATWTKKSWGTERCNERFAFVNKDTGWVAMRNNKLAKTMDGGQTWQMLNGVPFTGGILDMSFPSYNSGWVITLNSANSNVLLYKSTDGGVTWVAITLPFSVQQGTTTTVQFVDSQHGWIKGYTFDGEPSVLSTADGGAIWSANGFMPLTQLHNCYFLNAKVGYAIGEGFSGFSQNGGVYATKNGGISWKRLATAYNAFSLLIDDGAPAAVGGFEGYFYTLDSWLEPGDYRISGRIAQNVNNDCVADANETGIASNLVMALPEEVFGSSDNLGNYDLAGMSNPGIHTVNQTIGSLGYADQTQFCPTANGSQSVVLTATDQLKTGLNFINHVMDCPHLEIASFSQPLRPCRPSAINFIIKNRGKRTSDSVWVHITMPPQLHVHSANYPYTLLDSIVRIKIGPLAFGQHTTLVLYDSVKCDPNGLLGRTLCVKAVIVNSPTCVPPSPNWDGANLEVEGKCLVSGQTRFTIKNTGATMASTAQYHIFIDSVLVYQMPFQLAANGSMNVTLPLNAPAGFVRFVVPQSPFHPTSTFASAIVNCATGFISNGMFPEAEESPLLASSCVVVRNSYDPNDKAVFPPGIGTQGKIEPETPLKYTIRFQNTGTDTAFRVVLVDTLSENLDPFSIQVESMSHVGKLKVTGKGTPVLRFTFDNIYLPDSGANQLASNGYVSFSIRPKTGLPLGARLQNFADIYFDFNDPVRTNTTLNTLWRPTLVDGVLDTVFTVTSSRKSIAITGLSIYPNPTKGKLEMNSPEAGKMNLYNITGELILETAFEKGSNQFNLSPLPKGLYLARFQFGDMQEVRKVVLE